MRERLCLVSHAFLKHGKFCFSKRERGRQADGQADRQADQQADQQADR